MSMIKINLPTIAHFTLTPYRTSQLNCWKCCCGERCHLFRVSCHMIWHFAHTWRKRNPREQREQLRLINASVITVLFFFFFALGSNSGQSIYIHQLPTMLDCSFTRVFWRIWYCVWHFFQRLFLQCDSWCRNGWYCWNICYIFSVFFNLSLNF